MGTAGRFRAVAAAVAILGVAGSPLLGRDATAEMLKLGNEGTYPPFSIVDAKGELTGFEADLAREMCKRLAVECEFVVMDFKALIPSILQGKFAILASQLAPTPERLARLSYSRPIVYNPMAFVVRKDNPPTLTMEGLVSESVKLGLQRGAASIPYIDKHFGDVFERVFYDNPDQMKLDLLAGRVDAVFDSKINWTIELIEKPEGKDYALEGEHWIGDPGIPLAERGYSWAVPKGQEALLERMNAALTAIMEDCTFTALRKKYLSVPILAADQACADKAG